MARSCPGCGSEAPPRRRYGRCLGWVIAAWLIPLGFLLSGYWPFGLLPVSVLTLWCLLSARRVCPSCGHQA